MSLPKKHQPELLTVSFPNAYIEKVHLKTKYQVVPKQKNMNPWFPSPTKQIFDFSISEEQLKEDLEAFSGARETKIGGQTTRISERQSSQGREKARAWLKEQYLSLGFNVATHDYRTGKNFLAEKEGLDKSKVLILSAHFDSVHNPGADDNGSGTISVLAAARALAHHSLKYNLRVLGFDEEEHGLVGSRAYAAHLSQENQMGSILGVFNVEMSGYDGDSDGAFHVIDCNENTSAQLSQIILDAVDNYALNLVRSPACTNRSDHAAFWAYGAPAIVIAQNFFGGDSNPCYHLACDKTDRIHWSYMTELTKALTYGVGSVLVDNE